MSLVLVLAGVLVIALRGPLARLQTRSQNRTWGFNFGERAEAVSRTVFFVIGAGLIVAGPVNLAIVLLG